MADQLAPPAGDFTSDDITRLRGMLDQLEAAGGEPASQLGADTFSADAGQVIAPDGSVTYDFHDAHIKAQGIDLDAAGTPTLQATSVRWLKQADGSVVAYVSGLDQTATGGPAALWQGAQLPSGAAASMRIEAFPPNATQLTAHASDGTVDQARTIIDSAGRSNFLQTPASNFLLLEGAFTYTATVGPQAVATSGLFTLGTAVPLGGTIVPIGAITVAAGGPQVAFTWHARFANSQQFDVTLFNAAAAGSPARTVTWQGMVIHG